MGYVRETPPIKKETSTGCVRESASKKKKKKERKEKKLKRRKKEKRRRNKIQHGMCKSNSLYKKSAQDV